MEPQKSDFLKAEYVSLRQEIVDTLKEVTKNERLALGLSGAFWSWLVVKAPGFHYLYFVSWLPFALTLLLSLRAYELGRKFDVFREYIMKVEKEFQLEGFGWEHFLRSKGNEWHSHSSRIVWYLLLGGNLALATFFVVAKLIY